ncbi:hypothetical protein ABBQ38_003083 [Trebouxia sp. C0009 RCD-2024]
MPGIQRQPLQKHNTPGSSLDILVRNGSSFKVSANNAALSEPTDSLSATRCSRPSQDCQTPTPSRGIAARVAACQKRHPLSACAANGSRSPEGLSLPSRQPSARGHASKGSESRPTPSGLAGPLVSPDKPASSQDSQKWLAFTPPASLSRAHSSRRVSQGLPGGAGKPLSQPDDSALRLPPLTPPGTEVSSSSSLPHPSAMPAASGSASPNLWRSANRPASGPGSHPTGSLPPSTAAADVDTLANNMHLQQALVQQGKGASTTQPALHAAGSAASCSQLANSDSEASVGEKQVQAKPVVVHAREQAQAVGRPHGSSSPMQPQSLHAGLAGGDIGQLGPPITRMRPASLPATSSSAGKKSTGKQQAAADSAPSFAEAILLDAVLCGWEQQTNDGDLYPLTVALEKEGAEGVHLQGLRLPAHLQLADRPAGPPLPPGPPLRTKAGKPRRTWRQE